jgi:hypothetical protein
MTPPVCGVRGPGRYRKTLTAGAGSSIAKILVLTGCRHRSDPTSMDRPCPPSPPAHRVRRALDATTPDHLGSMS